MCLSYIRRELQQLSHSPHYINLPFILKCVPACLAQHSVQGKGICFVPCSLPHRLSLIHSRPMGEMVREGERGGGGRHGGGMRNGLRAVSREGRRCQSHESGDAPPGTFLSQLFHNTPSFAHSSLSLHFFFSLSLRPSVQILPNQHLSPHLALTRFSNQSKMK